MPELRRFDDECLGAFENVKEAISGIRKIRLENSVPIKDPLELFVQPGEKGYIAELNPIISRLGNISRVRIIDSEVKGAASFRVKSTNYYVQLADHIDYEEEVRKLCQELEYTKGFLISVLRKLGNEKFVSSAPAVVVDKERIKQSDAEARIKVLEERIKAITK